MNNAKRTIGCAGLVLCLAAGWASATGPFDAWSCRAQVTFSGYTRPETLTNVPMLVVLGPNTVSGFDCNQFLSGSNADLRFTDSTGATELDYEIEKWDATGNSYVWVQVPLLVDATTYVQAWWGMPGQTAPDYTTNGATWTNGYAGVWHMSDPTCPDSTSNHWFATGTGLSVTNGLAGNALYFGAGYAQLTNAFNVTGGRYTGEAWGQLTTGTTQTDNRVFDALGPGSANRLILRWNQPAAGKISYYVTQDQPTTGCGTNLNDGTWQQTAWILDKSNNVGRLYQGGQYVGFGTFATTNIGGIGSTNRIGCAANNVSGFVRGSLDELRISGVPRSSNWVWACALNLASNAAFNVAVPLALTPVVLSLPATNIWDTWANLNASLTTTGFSPVTVAVYWGFSDGSTNAANWPHTNVFDTVAGACPVALTTNIAGLTASTGYAYRYSVTNTDGFVYWSAPQTFATLSPVTPPVVNNDAGPLLGPLFTASLQGQVTAGSPAPVAYVCWGTANAGTTDTGAWQHVDGMGTNSGNFADPVSGLMATTVYYYACFATNALGGGWSSVASFIAGTNVIWTGAGGNASWNNAANWSGSAVPGPSDTAIFTDAGLTNNKVISLDASQTVYGVTIATITNFTIGAASDTIGVTNSLALVNLTRQFINGSEGIHILGAPVILMPDADSNCTWTVDGGNYLRVNARLSAAASGVTLVKSGAGQLNMNYASPSFNGTSRVIAGNLTANSSSTIQGTIIVGGDTNAASFTANANCLFGPASIVGLTNASITLNGQTSSRFYSLTVYTDVVANVSGYVYLGANSAGFTLAGGKILGGNIVGVYGQYVRSYASDRTAVFSMTGGWAGGSGYKLSLLVDEGPAVIDLDYQANLSVNGGGTMDNGVVKSGNGTVAFEGYSSVTSKAGVPSLEVQAGTVLLNNATGSGHGKGSLKLDAGATLGGTGIVGGVSGYTNADLVVASGASTNALTTVSPGTLDTNTGASLIGTLTVGSAVQSNNATFGKFTRLYAQVGAGGASDQFVVNGYLNLGTNGNNTYLDIAALDGTRGSYTLATFGGLTGRFTNVRSVGDVTLPAGATVQYLGTPTGSGNELVGGSIVLTLPPSGSLLIVR